MDVEVVLCRAILCFGEMHQPLYAREGVFVAGRRTLPSLFIGWRSLLRSRFSAASESFPFFAVLAAAVKPDNMLIFRHEVHRDGFSYPIVKLSDFGLSRASKFLLLLSHHTP